MCHKFKKHFERASAMLSLTSMKQFLYPDGDLEHT